MYPARPAPPTPTARWVQRQCRLWWDAANLFVAIDGSHRAAAFAYFAFFAIFPLIVVLVMAGSIFFDYQNATSRVMDLVGEYIPSISRNADSRGEVFGAVQTVLNSRRSASLIAIGVMLWSALGFFEALIRAVNTAWRCGEMPWWRLPLKNGFMLAILGTALLVGLITPLLVEALTAALRNWLPLVYVNVSSLLDLARTLLPIVVLFYGFLMFYRFAPLRRTTFGEVWGAALACSLVLVFLQKAFVLYARNISNFNQFYGALGGVLAVLMWIYLSGSVIIFGGCLCAMRHRLREEKTPVPATEDTRRVE